MTDPREQPLNDVARKIMVTSNYDPHFSAIEERIIMETKLFLARLDALDGHYAQRESARLEHRSVPRIPEPIPMILFCPSCGMQHLDAAEPHKLECNVMAPLAPGGPIIRSIICDCGRWANPPHRSHLCAGCSKVWRPADVPTIGVADISTRGSRDSATVRGWVEDIPAGQRWLHLSRLTIYTEIGRGELQMSGSADETAISEGDRMVVYRGEDGKFWVRLEREFEDGRFEKL